MKMTIEARRSALTALLGGFEEIEMELLTLVMLVLVVAFVYVALSTTYDIGKRKGHRDCAPDSERADRYRDAVDALDKWCGHESPQARLIAAPVGVRWNEKLEL